MKRKKHWKTLNKIKFNRIVRDICKENGIKIKYIKQYCGAAYLKNDSKFIEIPKVTGYVSFALALHEIFHHLTPGIKYNAHKHRIAYEEFYSWKRVMDTFLENNIPWVNSVSALANKCLARALTEDIDEKHREQLPKELKALLIAHNAGL